MLTRHRLQHIEAVPGEGKEGAEAQGADGIGGIRMSCGVRRMRGKSTRQIANTNAKLENLLQNVQK